MVPSGHLASKSAPAKAVVSVVVGFPELRFSLMTRPFWLRNGKEQKSHPQYIGQRFFGGKAGKVHMITMQHPRKKSP